jgi:predicted ester cyclase
LKVNAENAAVGRVAIAAVAQAFMSAFPDLVVQMDRLTQQGIQVTYHWTLIGTNSGPGGTGNRVRVSGFEDWRFGPDGLIAESIGQFDAADYRRQLNTGATGR